MIPSSADRGLIGVHCDMSSDPGLVSGGPAPSNPQEAVSMLYSGNARFAAGRPLAINRDITRVKEVAMQQTPFAAFLGCADSRVPVEIVFDQGFGDVFVTRIAGNLATSENVASLEFGAALLGAKVIYVLGHTNCGAVVAAMNGEDAPGQISGLFQHLRPAIKRCAGDVLLAVTENVRNQGLILAECSPVIRKLVASGELIVAGGVYDLQTGVVTPVEIKD